jgi:flagellar motor switch protein FliN
MTDVTTADSDQKNENIMKLNALGGVMVRLSVEVGSVSMRLAELLSLEPGSVIELDRQAGDPLDVLANGTLVARGEIVSVDGRYGIRITETITPDSWNARRERRGS